jgi:hypothetical protein
VVDVAQNWLMSRSLTIWLISHPIWGLGFVFLVIVVLGGLLRSLTQFIEKLWGIVLRSPLNLGRWLLKKVLRLFNYRTVEAASPEIPAPQLDEIVERLERLQEEQKQLLLDVKTLFAQQQVQTKEGDQAVLDPTFRSSGRQKNN